MKTIYNQEFEKRYNRLNAAQKQAVDTIEGPVMVVAGPGTGKTTILTLRIANILQRTDTPPSGILAITFTDAGVKSMKQKLTEIIGNRALEVRIHTFHGFAASVIAEFKDHFVHLYGTRQITDIESESIVRGVIDHADFVDLRPFGNPEFYIRPILEAIRDSKREALSPEMVASFASGEIARISSDESSISTRGVTKGELKADVKKRIEKCEKTILFSQVYDKYEKAKKLGSQIDFDDLIFELLLALGRDELLLRQIQEKYLYIHIDEHQDTNDAQNLIIKMLGDFFDVPNIFIVGDEKQAIYRFQGASISNFLQFKKSFADMQIISLEHNYRSGQSLLDATFGMIESNYDGDEQSDLRVRLRSGSTKPDQPIQIATAPDVESAELYLVSQLKQIQLNHPTDTVAIISKNNRDIERIIRLCESHGVPISAERSIDIFSHPVGNLFFSLVEFINDQSQVGALGHTIASGLWGLEFAQSVAMNKELRAGHVERVLADIPSLPNIVREMLDDSPMIFIMNLAEYSGYRELVSRDPAYVEVWRAIVNLCADIITNSDLTDPRILLQRLADYKISSTTKSVKIPVGVSTCNFRAMTAHSSKGLEFDHVFIPYATEDSWGSRRRNSYFIMPIDAQVGEEDEIRDARRLFYVAITRARENVTIIIPKSDSLSREILPLRFVSELGDVNTSLLDVPKSEVSSILARHSGQSRQGKLLDYIRSTLEHSGLSVTALNHFLNCPNEFIYKSILKVPELPNANSDKGNAMHLAMDRVWHLEHRTVEAIESTIESAVHDHMSRSMLRKLEREVIMRDLISRAREVATSLYGHFQTDGAVFSEHWVENISGIKIHGRTDAIVVGSDSINVYDYKTRGKMSEKQIKDGGYFRQLVFYKLLLSGSSNLRSVIGDRTVTPSLVFLTPDTKGVCRIETLPITQEDIETLQSEIAELVVSVESGRIMDGFCSEPKCEFCAKKKLLLSE